MVGDPLYVEALAWPESNGLGEGPCGLVGARRGRRPEGKEDRECPEVRSERAKIATPTFLVKLSPGAGHEGDMLTHTHSLLRVLTFTGALTALFDIGCVTSTEVGTQDTPLSDGDVHAIAFHQAPDPDTLHVVLSTFSLACTDPGAGPSGGDGCAVGWTINFTLPAASQAPGVYSLSDPALQSGVSLLLGSDGEGRCVGGGSGGFGGKVEVVSIDASTIKVRLSDFNSDGDLPPADGDYDVPRCL